MIRRWFVLLAVLAMTAAGCGSADSNSASSDSTDSDQTTDAGQASEAADSDEPAPTDGAEPPVLVVTTNILGDVVEQMVGDQLVVVTIMPVGADPHDFQPSAAQVAEISQADALITNGASFEEGLIDLIESAESDGVPLYEAITAVTTIEFGEGGHEHEHGDDEHGDDEHGDDEHGDDEHSDEDHDHDHDGDDPHFFTDPARMALAAEGIADFLIANVAGVDAEALRANADAYIGELRAVDAEIEQTLGSVPEDRRVLVTNHEVFGYFADRYGFEVVGTVVPGGGTTDGVSAEALVELAEVIEREGVPAIFADTSSSDQLAQTLASEVGDVAVVQLFTESLGEEGSGGSTYIDMVRTNAQRIADALT